MCLTTDQKILGSTPVWGVYGTCLVATTTPAPQHQNKNLLDNTQSTTMKLEKTTIHLYPNAKSTPKRVSSEVHKHRVSNG